MPVPPASQYEYLPAPEAVELSLEEQQAHAAYDRSVVLDLLGYPATRLGKMVALLMRYEHNIALYGTGSVELHFTPTDVKAHLKTVLPTD